MFSVQSKTFFSFESPLFSVNAFNLDKSKFCRLVQSYAITVNNDLNASTLIQRKRAEPRISVGSVLDFRRRGRQFDSRLGQYSFRGLMIVIATGFKYPTPLSVVLTMAMWGSSQ